MNKPPLPDVLRLPAISLAAHAYEYHRPSGVMSDQIAHNWFGQLNRQYEQMPLPDVELTNGIIVRSLIIDYALLDFVIHNPNVVICDLGCGFSTRRYRLGLIWERWMHLDLPSVMEHRRAFRPLDDNEIWRLGDLCDLMGQFLPYDPQTNSICFICEGVLNHLPRTAALGLLRLLHEQYPGASFIGTVITKMGLHGARGLADNMGLNVTNMWAVEGWDELQEILNPSRLQRIWLLGKVASRIGLIRPVKNDEASGFVFCATL